MDISWTLLRSNAKNIFDAVASGQTVRIFRYGNAVAQIVQYALSSRNILNTVSSKILMSSIGVQKRK